MAKGKGREFFEIDEGTSPSRAYGSIKKAKLNSPASELLYRRGSSGQGPQNSPNARAGMPPRYSTKTAMFWIVCCAVVGLGAYLLIVVGSSKVGDNQNNIAVTKKTTDENYARRVEPKPSTPRERTLKPERLTIEEHVAPPSADELVWTVRIIQVPASRRDKLNELLQHRDFAALIGSNKAFIVDKSHGQIVGCVGAFASVDDPKAIELAKALDKFQINRQQPFKGAMRWKFK